MKTVAIVSGVLSESVLLGDVEVQTRWSLGSLVSSILSRSADPLVLLLKDTAQGVMGLKAYALPVAGLPAAIAASTPDLILARGAGSSKSRPVEIENPPVVVTPTTVTIQNNPADLNDPYDSMLVSLVANVGAPSYSLLGILNKLETYLSELAPGWALIIDQDSETIRLIGNRAEVGVNADLVALIEAEVAVADFSLTADAVNEVIPGFGWE